MASLKPVIVPAKALKGGKHKIRIAVAHNGTTRYIVTDIGIDSAKEFKCGQVVKRPDAAMKNTVLRRELQKLQQSLDELGYIDGLTCAELVFQLKNADKMRNRTLVSVYEEYMDNSHSVSRPGTQATYRSYWKQIDACVNGKTILEHITHATVLRLDKFLREKYKIASVRVITMFFKAIVSYAAHCGYVSYRINPFWGYSCPRGFPRDSWLTVDEVRRVRDLQTDDIKLAKARDIFMLSYYLGGINLVDLFGLDIYTLGTTLKYERSKTKGKPKINRYVEFEIPEEAIDIITRNDVGTGMFDFTDFQRHSCLKDFFRLQMPKLAKAVEAPQLIYYSARKSFSQHAFQLGVPTPVIDFILGHRVDKGGDCLFSYINVTPDIATKAVRKVLDNLK